MEVQHGFLNGVAVCGCDDGVAMLYGCGHQCGVWGDTCSGRHTVCGNAVNVHDKIHQLHFLGCTVTYTVTLLAIIGSSNG